MTSIRQSQSQEHFEWIDILRGLAALAVVLFHVRVDLWVGWNAIRLEPEKFSALDRLTAWISAPFPFFGSGVILFFLLSGFCIHYPSAKEGWVDARSYAIRRFLRIVPPYLAAVVFSLLLEQLGSHFFGSPVSSMVSRWKTLLFVQNYPPDPGQLVSNPSLWSLPVEMELYILYPLVLVLSSRLGRAQVMAGIAILSCATSMLAAGAVPWLAGTFAKYWIIWCAGALLAQWTRENRLPQWRTQYWVPTAGIFAGAMLLHVKGAGLGMDHFLWAAGFFLLMWRCLSGSPASAILPTPALRALQWLGTISFSLYLIHFPLFRLLGSLWVDWHGTKPSSLFVSLTAAVLAVAVAGLFYRWVEFPAHRLARRLGSRS